jgi:acetyl-CoA synthetase
MKAVADEAIAAARAVERVIVLKYTGAPGAGMGTATSGWHNVVEGRPRRAPTEHTEAEDPLMIIYTSGGRPPQGAVHYCGFPSKLRRIWRTDWTSTLPIRCTG